MRRVGRQMLWASDMGRQAAEYYAFKAVVIVALEQRLRLDSLDGVPVDKARKHQVDRIKRVMDEAVALGVVKPHVAIREITPSESSSATSVGKNQRKSNNDDGTK